MEFYLKGRNQGAFQEQYSRKMKQAWGCCLVGLRYWIGTRGLEHARQVFCH